MRIFKLLFLIGAATLATACPKVGTTTAGNVLKINLSGIAKRLNCSPDQVTLVEQGDQTTVKANGCGASEMYTQIGDARVWIPMQDLRARSAFDLDCAEEDITMSALSARQQGVRGCGNRATYTYVRTDEDRWDWIMDSASSSQ